MKRGVKAQVAVEFLFLVAIMFTVFIVYAAFTRERISTMMDDQRYILLKDQAEVTRDEIILASQVHDGYTRQFMMPQMLGDSYNYTVSIEGGTLKFESGYGSSLQRVEVAVPPFSGSIGLGLNEINKTGGVVYITHLP
jgi:hypothetical protein